MEKYFRLRPSAAPEISGAYPQVTLADFKLLSYFQDLDRSQPFEWTPDFDQFKFADGAIETDLVTCSIISSDKGFVVSRRFYDFQNELIQKGLKTLPMNAVPMNIQGREYFLIQLMERETLVDWENSIFEDLLEDEETLVPLSKGEYTPMRYTTKEIKLSRDCDLFQLQFGIEVIVSGKLKNLLENSDLTGIDRILPFDWFAIK